VLIVLPSTPTTQRASAFLNEQRIAHQLIPLPASLNYQNGATQALYFPPPPPEVDIAMLLTRQRFVVMRVFKDYVHAE
jgi:hypothetical protein